MADEQSMIFKSEDGTFDRAGVIKETIGDISVENKVKSAEKAIEEASDFYKKEYYSSLKELDPAYDPKAFEYMYARNKTGEDLKDIKKTIDKGEGIDSKDLIPKAKSTAEEHVKNAQFIKNGSITQIIEKIGLGAIKEMDKAEEVIEEFNSKLKGTKFNFDQIFEKFQEILSFYNNGTPDPRQSQILYSPENNAIIAALAKIIQRNGGKNDAIEKSASKFEEYLKTLAEGKSTPLEDAKEKPKNEEKKEESKLQEEKQKLEEKKEEGEKEESDKIEAAKTEGEETKKVTGVTKIEDKKETLELKTTPPVIEGAKEETTPAKTITPSMAFEEGVSSAESQIETLKKEKKPKMGTHRGLDFLKSIFGGHRFEEGDTSEIATAETITPQMAGEKGEGTAETQIETLKKEKKPEMGAHRVVDFLKSIFGNSRFEEGGTSETTTTKEKPIEAVGEGMKSGATKLFETKGEGTKTPIIETSKGSVLDQVKNESEKKLTGTETKKEIDSIKEISPQKLSKVITDTPSEKVQKETPITKSEEVKIETNKEEVIQEKYKEEKGKPDKGTEKTTNSEASSFGNEILEQKMDMVITLLTQLNETLQGPILTTNVNKNFE